MTKDERNMTQEEGRETQGANQRRPTPASGDGARTDKEVVELVGGDEVGGQVGSGQILLGDALERLRELASGSVDTVVTSPPYFLLRNYGVDGQLGAEQTVAQWVAGLRAVMGEVARVLKRDGSVWLNLGDTYSRHGGQKQAGLGQAQPDARLGARQTELHLGAHLPTGAITQLLLRSRCGAGSADRRDNAQEAFWGQAGTACQVRVP